MTRKSTEWRDLTIPICHGMTVWPGNPRVSVTRVRDLDQGDRCNLSEIHLGAHSGTHLDGLNHFIKGAPGIDQMPLELMSGSARVIEIKNPDAITAEELIPHDLQADERVLFKTRNSSELYPLATFSESFVYIGNCAAELLTDRKVAMVGVDYLSIGGYRGNVLEVHHELLGGGVWCIEGLDLRPVSAGRYEFLCLPIRLVDGDGGLARAIARRIEQEDGDPGAKSGI